MLARARFETETPNVIDAGEDAPFQPSRREPSRNIDFNLPACQNGSSDDDSRSSASRSGFLQDNRCQQLYTASNKGHIPKGVRISYNLEAEEEPDASTPFEDEEGGDSYGYPSSGVSSYSENGELQLRGQRNSLPRQQNQCRSSYNARDSAKSIEEARLFAAAMLNESERRVNLHNEHNLSLRQESSSTLRQMMTKATSFRGGGSKRFYDEISLIEEPAIRASEPKRFRNLMLCRLLVFAVAVALVVVFGVVAAGRSSQNNSSGTDLVDNQARLDATITFLFNHEISSEDDLHDRSTPQYQAAHWLATVDPEELSVPAVGNDPISRLHDSDAFRFVQRYVLAVLYYALDGEQWTSSHKFTSDVHECSWFEPTEERDGETYAMGVTCDQNLHVQNLLLPSNNLRGTLPPEIQHLSKLNFLDLSSNELNGALPSELKMLTLLKFLRLDTNHITGAIPPWLGDSLSSLQALGLSDNLLDGSLPGSLANGLASNLKTLSLSNNMLTGNIAILQRMRFLKFLYLNDNDFEGRLDHGLLADMPFLLEADLSNNRLSSRLPDYLFMRKLKILDLSSNHFMGNIPLAGGESAEASPLEFLSLRNNSLSESIPSGLMTHLSRLRHLDLSFNQLTGDCPQAIGDMVELSYLFLGNNSLSVSGGTIPDHLQSLTKLRELSLGNMNLHGPIPTWLEDFGDLRLLDLSQNQLTGSIDLDFQKLQNLIFLILHDNLLSSSLPVSLGALQNLVVLSLHQNDIVDNGDSAGSICADDSKLELITVDCGEIDCPCCDECCDDDDCYDGVIWETLEHNDGDWEERFERSNYSFNPHITMPGG